VRGARLRRQHFFVGENIQKLHASHFQAVDDLGGFGLQQRVHDQQRNRRDQTERRTVHGFGDGRRQQRRFLRRVGVTDGGERRDQTDNGTDQTEQRGDVRQRRQILRAF